jgi:hypothetical protein
MIDTLLAFPNGWYKELAYLENALLALPNGWYKELAYLENAVMSCLIWIRI